MRFLFTTTGHAGHVLPLVPLARACLRAGHEVRVAGPRSRGGVVRDAGLPFWPFDDPPEDEVREVFAPTAAMPAEEANAVVIGEVFGRLAAGAALPGVQAMVEAWRPDAIVRESYEFASVRAAERAGVPHVRVATGLASTEEWVLGHVADAPVEEIRASPLISFTPPGLDDGPVAHRFRTVCAGVAGEPLGRAARLRHLRLGRVEHAAVPGDLPHRSRGAGGPARAGADDDRLAGRPGGPRAAAGQRDRRALGPAGLRHCARCRGGVPRRLRHDDRRAGRRRAARGGAAVRGSGAERGAGG